jgi:hypothetical protein
MKNDEKNQKKKRIKKLKNLLFDCGNFNFFMRKIRII